jgi:hypothetical protein
MADGIMILQAWTGPCSVGRLAEACRKAGLDVTCEGTERVYIAVPYSPDRYVAGFDACEALRKTHGTTFGLRFC